MGRQTFISTQDHDHIEIHTHKPSAYSLNNKHFLHSAMFTVFSDKNNAHSSKMAGRLPHCSRPDHNDRVLQENITTASLQNDTVTGNRFWSGLLSAFLKAKIRVLNIQAAASHY